MGNTAVLDQPASTEVLIFYIPGGEGIGSDAGGC